MKGVNERSPAERERIDAAWELWEEADRLTGGSSVDHVLARAYFRARGIKLEGLPAWVEGGETGTLPATIRYHPSLRYYAEVGDKTKNIGESPCLLFRFDDVFGDFIGLHQIWLEPDGSSRKRTVPEGNSPKKIFRGTKPDGCCIRFGEPTKSTLILPVGEGPETMLAVCAAIGSPTWCTYSSGNLVKIQIPQKYIDPQIGTLEAVVVMADHDMAKLLWSDMLNRRVLMRTGWDRALQAALRVEQLYRIKGLVASPGDPTLRLTGLMKEPGGDERRKTPEGEQDAPINVGGVNDGFVDSIDGRKVDWLDVSAHKGEGCGPGKVEKAVYSAKSMDDIAPEMLYAAPVAKQWAIEGIPREFLLDDPDEVAKAEKKEKDQKQAKQLDDDGFILPQHSADRARFCLDRLYAPRDKDGISSAAVRANSRHHICHWIESDTWLHYAGGRWKAVKSDEISGEIVDDLRNLMQRNKNGKVTRAELKSNVGEDVLKAIKPLVSVRGQGMPFMAPATFDEKGSPIYETSLRRLRMSPLSDDRDVFDTHADVLVFPEGVLKIADLVEGDITLSAHTPRLISTSLIPFHLPAKELQAELDRDPEGKDRGLPLIKKYAPLFLQHLNEIFDDDQETINEMQKWFGLCQTNDVSHEIGAMLIGPRGSGKGTLLQCLERCIGGAEACATFKFSSFGDRNETYALLGKRLAITTDMRVDGRDNSAELEQCLTIMGGDPVSAEGKFKDKNPFVYMPIKLMFVSNPVPRLYDPSLAMARRLIFFHTSESFVGREDRGRKRKLRAEAMGIMLFSLFGLRALRLEGKFNQPKRSQPKAEKFKRFSSSMYAFCDDVMAESPGSEVAESVVFALYRAWARDQGLEGKPSKDKMFGDLAMIFTHAEQAISHTKQGAVRVIRGVRPKLLLDELAAEKGTPLMKDAIHEMKPDDFADFGFELPDTTRYGNRAPSYSGSYDREPEDDLLGHT